VEWIKRHSENGVGLIFGSLLKLMWLVKCLSLVKMYSHIIGYSIFLRFNFIGDMKMSHFFIPFSFNYYNLSLKGMMKWLQYEKHKK
jgi:hypothetical protein